MEQPTRVCAKCGVSKPLTAYAKASWCRDGRRGTCQECRTGGDKRQVSEKRCGACGNVKPVDEFWRRGSSPDGYHQACRLCLRAMKAAEYRRNKKAINARSRAHYEANRAERIARQTEWKKANPEKVAEYGRIGQQRHRVARTAATAAWRAENPDVAAEVWRRRRARLKNASVGAVDLDALWTGLCGICGEPLDRELKHPDPLSKSVDHIVPLAKGGAHEQTNLQWAHLVCNIRKGARPSD